MNYWDRRFQSNPDGEGHEAGYRWLWEIADRYAPSPDSVLDVGCGDLSFWDGRKCQDYVGVDTSPTIIERNRRSRPTWVFLLQNAADALPPKDCVFCFNLLYHILDDGEYERILRSLIEATGKHLFIFTWAKDPYRSPSFLLRNPGTAVHHLLKRPGRYGVLPQKYRRLDLSFFRSRGLALVGEHRCHLRRSAGTMYVFRRTDENHAGH